MQWDNGPREGVMPFGTRGAAIEKERVHTMILKRGGTDFLKEIRTKLYVAVVSDVLDSLGYTDQAMSSRIRPLDDSLVLVGYARTGLYQDIYHVTEGENPYELEIALKIGRASC